MNNVEKNHTIIFFDNECVLCNRLVVFLLQRNKNKRLKFASILGSYYNSTKEKYQIKDIDSIVVIENQKAYYKSAAVFAVINQLGGFWKVISIFKILPQKFNDFLYDLVAKYRYKLFGRTTCYIPKPSEKEHFLL